MITTRTKGDVEQDPLVCVSGFSWQVTHGPDIAPKTPNAERDDYRKVVLEQRLRDAFARLNTDIPTTALDDMFRWLTRPEGSTLGVRNCAFLRMLVN